MEREKSFTQMVLEQMDFHVQKKQEKKSIDTDPTFSQNLL